MCAIVSEGDYVVLMKSFDLENIKIIPVNRGTTVHYGKLHFDPSAMIGSKFGSVFEIVDNNMIRVDDFEALDKDLSLSVSNKLATFNDKTQFSQEKIIKKKKRDNHANIVTVVQPTLLHINGMLYTRGKLGGLRHDSLSQILTLANIQNGSRCLLMDHNLGLVTGAVMSRILPDGICIQLVADPEAICTTRRTLSMLNIRKELCENRLMALTVRDLYKICKGIDNFDHENQLFHLRAKERLERVAQMSARSVFDPDPGEKVTIEPDNLKKLDLERTLIKKDSNREMRNKERSNASGHLKGNLLNSLIIVAQNDHPLYILKLTYKFLANSGQFVIYSDSMEPLLECYRHLKTNAMAVSLNISETWLRRYQVLPDRTRPEMNISGFGGYLLSGTKVLIGSPIEQNIVAESEQRCVELEGPVMDVQVEAE